ncbi:hypothetical protein [Pseudoramibacter alactolyticus]
MIIKKHRIFSIDKYLGFINKDKKIYICVPFNEENFDTLKTKSEIKEYEIGRKTLPIVCGPITRFNCHGKEIVHKNKEKEDRVFERDYHVVDWHGNDHYGTCFQTRKCYPKTIIDPPLEEIILDSAVIRSDLISVSDKDRLVHVVNMFLELFGYCEVLDETENPINKDIKIKTISWKILPPGKYPWDKAEKELENYFKNATLKNKRVLKNRHKAISDNNPDFMAIGQDSFNGYVVYGFIAKNLYVFESNRINNATYIFKGKWEETSKLTKRDVIKGRLCYKRLIHSEEWNEKIDNILNEEEI